MKLILKRKTTAGVLAVFTKAIADLKHISEQATIDKEAALREAERLDDIADLRRAEAEEADAVRRKLEELIQG